MSATQRSGTDGVGQRFYQFIWKGQWLMSIWNTVTCVDCVIWGEDTVKKPVEPAINPNVSNIAYANCSTNWRLGLPKGETLAPEGHEPRVDLGGSVHEDRARVPCGASTVLGHISVGPRSSMIASLLRRALPCQAPDALRNAMSTDFYCHGCIHCLQAFCGMIRCC